MNKILKKTSACVLSAIFTLSQNAVFAEMPINLTKDSPQEKLSVLGEVPEKRSEFAKHFRMSDGSMKAVVYSDQVNYKDGDEFKEIDNTLVDGDNNTYKNTDSPFKVSLSKNFKNKDLVNIESNNHSVSMSYIKKKYKKFVDVSASEETEQNKSISSAKDSVPLKQNSENKRSDAAGNKLVSQAIREEDLSKIPETELDLSSAEIENLDKTKMHFKDENEEKIYIEKAYSKAKYQNSDVNVDLDYALSGLGLKENIILKNRSNDNDKFDFEAKTDLIAAKDESGNINFKDSSEKTVFTMPKGCMWDSNDAFSGDVNYEISKITGGYIISVIPNRDWIDDNSRSYPITIDPSITTSSDIDASSFEYAYVVTDPSNPNLNYNNHKHIPVGTTDYNYISFLKYTKLPEFSHGEIVTGSKFSMYLPSSYSDMPVTFGSLPQYDCVHEVMEPWEDTTLTSSNMPSVSNLVSDYAKVDATDKWYDWDMTKLVKTWYALDNPNNNFGFSFNTINPANYGLVRYVSKTGEYSSTKAPKLEINYREFVGEENYWAYKSHSAGYKGAGKVNSYAGTLSVFENVLSYSGSLNPVSISNTYNNVNYNEQANAYFHTKEIPGGYSKSSFSGLGFRLNFDKAVYPLPSTDYMYSQGWRYIYIDGDGTQHYFKLENSKIVDEDGLGLTLNLNDQSKIEITDLKDNKLIFYKPEANDELYVLEIQEDNNGNATRYNYEGGKITSITDAANRVTTISYVDSTNKVSKITAADGKEINFSYSGDRLKEISYPENMKTSYEYDHQGRLCLVSTNESSGRSVKYEYASNDKDSSNFFKIRSFTEFGSQNASENTKGGTTEFWYDMNQTKITNKINNLDVPYHENTEIWQFDNQGRATDIIDENGNFHETEYFKSSEETSRTKHRIKETATGQKIVHNLLKNSRADTSDTSNWEIENWNPDHQSSENCCGITASSDEKNLGNNSFKVYCSQNHASWPVAKQIVEVPVSSEDQKYTLSADVKIDGELSGGEGASIYIGAFKDNVQTSGDNYSRWLKSTDNEWKRISVTVNVPAGSNFVRCYFGMKNSSGNAYFDCLQLEKGDTANNYNMLQCSDFKESAGVWAGNNLDSSADVITANGMKITGDTETSKNICQRIDVNKKNPTFNVAIKAQAKSVPKKEIQSGDSEGSGFLAKFEIHYAGNVATETITENLNQSIYEDQYYFNSIPSQKYAVANNVLTLPDRQVDYVMLYICYNNNCNEAYIKEAQVAIEDSLDMYHYNENGNPDGVKDKLGNNNNTEYTSANEPKKYIKNIDANTTEEVENTYNNNDAGHNLTSQTREFGNNKKSKSDYTYDNKGNVTSSELSSANEPNVRKIHTENTYQPNQNYLQTSKDERDKVTSYGYNANNGNLESVTNANNTQINYTYNNDGTLASETCSGLQNSYSYVNGVLDSITHKVSESLNSTYKFIRDIFGNITETKIGDKALSKSIYDAGGGLLRQVKYGNEQTVNYDYDDKGRLVKKTFGYEKGNKFGEITYTYDNKNRLVETYDSLNDLTMKLEYDRFGRVDHMQRSDGTTSDLTYDNFRNLVSKSVLKLFDISQTLTNTFGKGNLISSSSIQTNNNSILSKYDYDNIARLQNSDVLTPDESSGIRHEISYEDFGQDRTTGLVSSIEIKKKVEGNWTSTGEKFNYTYDDLGNITSVTDANNSPIATYVYDSLNQLVRENNSQTGKTVTYQYNAGGNLTEKKIYSYTTDEDLASATLENTVAYTYGDLNWADKLTSYNGEDIVYDAIGNPLEYRGWELEWSRGRKLDKASKIGYDINVSYKYDENGVRTQKIVNGITTDFITSGIKVLAQKSGDNTIIWQIDGNGNTVGFNYNGTPYFYIKNAQGDIIAIADTSGNLVAKYTYDSWGKLISIKDSSDADRTTDENFIGCINPIRYRGYYYDSETGLYYLNARYYDPEVGRFINVDETLAGGYNLFEYCYNNPIKNCDLYGNIPSEELLYLVRHCSDLLSNCRRSFRYHFEYGGIIYKKNGVYEIGKITTDNSGNGWTPDASELQNKLNNGYSLEAIWHTHPFVPNHAYFGMSDADIKCSEAANAPIFAHTASGEIFGYDPTDKSYCRSLGNLRDIKALDSYLIVRGISENDLVRDGIILFYNNNIPFHSPYDLKTGVTRNFWKKF